VRSNSAVVPSRQPSSTTRISTLIGLAWVHQLSRVRARIASLLNVGMTTVRSAFPRSPPAVTNHSPARSRAGRRTPRSVRVGSLARWFACVLTRFEPVLDSLPESQKVQGERRVDAAWELLSAEIERSPQQIGRARAMTVCGRKLRRSNLDGDPAEADPLKRRSERSG